MKKIMAFFLVALMVAGFAVPAHAAATRTNSAVLIDGGRVDFVAYNIGGNNYFKLRDIAQALTGSASTFEVGWDGEQRSISLVRGEVYTSVGGELSGEGTMDPQPVKTTATLTIDGRAFGIAAYNIENNNYFKLRDVGAAIDFEVDWDGAKNMIIIDTTKSYTPD